MFVKMPGTAYPYNIYGIKVPGYTTSSTEAEGDTLFRCQATGGRSSSFSNVSDLAFKNKHIRGGGRVLQEQKMGDGLSIQRMILDSEVSHW